MGPMNKESVVAAVLQRSQDHKEPLCKSSAVLEFDCLLLFHALNDSLAGAVD